MKAMTAMALAAMAATYLVLTLAEAIEPQCGDGEGRVIGQKIHAHTRTGARVPDMADPGGAGGLRWGAAYDDVARAFHCTFRSIYAMPLQWSNALMRAEGPGAAPRAWKGKTLETATFVFAAQGVGRLIAVSYTCDGATAGKVLAALQHTLGEPAEVTERDLWPFGPKYERETIRRWEGPSTTVTLTIPTVGKATIFIEATSAALDKIAREYPLALAPVLQKGRVYEE